MNHRRPHRFLRLLTSGFCLALALAAGEKAAHATNATEFPDNGSEQMARGGAWVARASDPLAAFYNPAGLAGQDTKITIQLNLNFGHTCFTRQQSAFDTTQEPLADANGVFPKTCSDVAPFPNPQIAMTYKITDRIGAALAVLGPSGVGTATWPRFVNDGAGQPQPSPNRYLLTDSNTLLLTPTLAQELGDVLADAGETDEALRTYSEVVEFDPADPAARRVLGDIYLRRGWYDAAYRQYKTLIDIDGRDPLAHLRLAAAAVGAGRVDEALRIERDVSSGEGNPGPNDPRVFARIESASRLGALYANPAAAAGATPDAIARKMKELGLFSGPGSLAILSWEDRDAKLYVGAADAKNDALAGETTDAGDIGLYAVLSPNDAFEKTAHAVKWKADAPNRAVKYKLTLVAWDGKGFKVTAKEGVIDSKAQSSPL